MNLHIFLLLVTLLGHSNLSFCQDELSLDRLVRRIESLEREGAAQKLQVSQLQEDRREDRARIRALEQERAGDLDRIRQLESEVEQLKESTTEGQNNVISQASELTNVINENQRNNRLIMDTENVAFHAYLAAPSSHNHIRQELLFDTVNLNIGDAYNNKTGMFVTPIDGIYIFSVSIAGQPNSDEHNHVDLMKNGKEIAGAYADGTSSGGLIDQGSVTATMQLSIGDVVYVSIQRHDDIALWGDKLTSFTGCLITPL